MGDDLLPEDESDLEEYKSKTQVKKELLELVDLANAIVDLGPSAIKKLPLDEQVMDAVTAAKDMHRKKPSFRRQLQFIGKLFRSRDTAPIYQALDNLKGQQAQEKAKFHKLEQLRDGLVESGDENLTTLINDHPTLDRQRLRQWIRQAKKEKELNKPPKAYREIFQYLKQELNN